VVSRTDPGGQMQGRRNVGRAGGQYKS